MKGSKLLLLFGAIFFCLGVATNVLYSSSHIIAFLIATIVFFAALVLDVSLIVEQWTRGRRGTEANKSSSLRFFIISILLFVGVLIIFAPYILLLESIRNISAADTVSGILGVVGGVFFFILSRYYAKKSQPEDK